MSSIKFRRSAFKWSIMWPSPSRAMIVLGSADFSKREGVQRAYWSPFRIRTVSWFWSEEFLGRPPKRAESMSRIHYLLFASVTTGRFSPLAVFQQGDLLCTIRLQVLYRGGHGLLVGPANRLDPETRGLLRDLGTQFFEGVSIRRFSWLGTWKGQQHMFATAVFLCRDDDSAPLDIKFTCLRTSDEGNKQKYPYRDCFVHSVLFECRTGGWLQRS